MFAAPGSGLSLMATRAQARDDGRMRDRTDATSARWERRWPDRPRARWLRGPRGSGPLRRPTDGRLGAGVAAGLASRLGLDVTLVRTAFVVATVFGGFGAAAYVLSWLLIPESGSSGNIATRALADRRGIALAAGLGSLLAILLILGSALGATWLGTVAWPLVVSVAGLVLIWRNAPAGEQALLRRLTDPLLGLAGGGSRTRIALRVAVATVLFFSGLSALLTGHPDKYTLHELGGVALVLAAVVIVLGPWWLRIARDLMVERQARVRAEERADMAARVHDSVLQTLALIQRRADDPQQVVQLARAQERELRSWLFDDRAPGSLDGQAATLADGIRLIQQEVEAQHGIPVEAITVGDCALDDDLAALLAAAREATVNAVKWSGADVVSLFAEVEPAEVAVYVRDRGRGFDPAAVPGDRKGLAESIHARMARRGGCAVVRTAPGDGTEVSLRMPRVAGERQPSRT
jgi:signal transduction histidine kinase/phage shock protein PspC (stress-responsive transcriptional regulator)